MLRGNRDVEHFSVAGRHHAVSSPNCSFAFNTFRNFLKKVDLNSYMNSAPLQMLIYQNYVLVCSEFSVAFIYSPFLSLSHLQLGKIPVCEDGKEKSKLGRGDDLL